MAERTQDASTTNEVSKDGPRAIIKSVDMSEDMQEESIGIATASLEKFNIEKDIAAQIKKEFDRRHGPTWHVVVGKNFGSYVTHGECPRISSHASSTRRCLARLGNRAHRSRFSQRQSTSSTSTSARLPSSSGSLNAPIDLAQTSSATRLPVHPTHQALSLVVAVLYCIPTCYLNHVKKHAEKVH